MKRKKLKRSLTLVDIQHAYEYVIKNSYPETPQGMVDWINEPRRRAGEPLRAFVENGQAMVLVPKENIERMKKMLAKSKKVV